MSVSKIIIFLVLALSFVPARAGGFTLLPDSLHSKSGESTDSWLGVDKALHVTGSMIFMAAVSINLQRRAAYSRPKALCVGFGLTFALGTVKEIWDGSKSDNYFSYKDLTANIIGTCIGAFLMSRD